MSDLEMTKLCAEAMGHRVHQTGDLLAVSDVLDETLRIAYNPLFVDAQAMALVKKFNLDLAATGSPGWTVMCMTDHAEDTAQFNTNLNRAIVECVAKMQQAKNEADRKFGQPHYGHGRDD